MKILVLNSGSSSLKFQLFNMTDMLVLATGLVEHIGETQSVTRMSFLKHNTIHSVSVDQPVRDHLQAITAMRTLLQENQCLSGLQDLAGIGHRVVHGGETFQQPVRITDEVIRTIEDLTPLAPLHNPANLIGIKVAHEQAPQVVQVAVFDTAFHQTIPPHGYTYGLPYALYEENRVRRYGFHGTSHYYVAKQAALHLGRDLSELKIISLHLGNGASCTAIRNGRSIDTSMGMTPLEGLLMGTRCGDMDPAILFYLARETGRTIQELDDLVNKESGLKGICGENDMRAVIKRAETGDDRAELALAVFCYRIKKYIGSYLAALNGADALIFTGGIGENAPLVRQRSCQDMERLNIALDPERNRSASAGSGHRVMEIQTDTDSMKILVIPTNEELEIATQTLQHIQRPG